MTIAEYLEKYGNECSVADGKIMTLPRPVRTIRNMNATQLWWFRQHNLVRIWLSNPKTNKWMALWWDNAPKALKKNIIDTLLNFD